ncbi:hypothetical protein INT44_001170 [Umbelopsis vinacea]|uniref:Phosphatidylglycerol/phosphatidylinositol transfer protein n=1 Tax=Umbelopsis vinacea TaxID=44442 RepID=A0A8H7Q9D6_9FUNG|nr:hypothetical protein INT44_001170 [Umbelopsis vinacea]
MRSILLLSLLAAAANAAVLPAFRVQEVGQTLSTDLITNCGDEHDILSIDYINLTPDPPVKGQPLDIEFKGWLSERVENGSYIDLTVKFGVVKLLQKRLDLCDQAKEIDTQCPIAAGEFTFTKSVDLPNEIRKCHVSVLSNFLAMFLELKDMTSLLLLDRNLGKYTVNAKIMTPDERQITCLNGVTTFPRQRLLAGLFD